MPHTLTNTCGGSQILPNGNGIGSSARNYHLVSVWVEIWSENSNHRRGF